MYGDGGKKSAFCRSAAILYYYSTKQMLLQNLFFTPMLQKSVELRG